MRYLVLAILVAGCSQEEKPWQKMAARVVWNTYPGVPFDPPEIEWREDKCGDGTRAGVQLDDGCYAGYTMSGYYVIIAWRGGYTASAFAHELLHANQFFRGLYDPNHFGREWSLVETANENLISRGIY